MGRRKVKLELISNDSVRKTTFRKRKAGLLKKVKELTTLCGVQGCAIIFGPNGESQPHVWPSPSEARDVLERFHGLPLEKQAKHMINYDGSVPRKQLLALKKENKQPRHKVKRKRDREPESELELEILLRALVEDGNEEKLFESIRVEEMKELCGFLDGRILEIDGEMEGLKEESSDVSSDGGDDDSDDTTDYEEQDEQESISSD